MASPCELLIESDDLQFAEHLTLMAQQEAQRIERKYSRYQNDNLMFKINNSGGKRVTIDGETFGLLKFANTCYQISGGMFDITSGILRRAWVFDGSDNIPNRKNVESLLPHIGWNKVYFDEACVVLADRHMELDFGGIGKEYAVDRVSKLVLDHAKSISVLVNFGGDIQVTQPRKNQQAWNIGIEGDAMSSHVLQIYQGGLATSGDTNRFLLKNGIRYSHVLNPKTGYPIEQAARSITVAAQYCTQAGLLATLALLQGQWAENFLKEQGVQYWCGK